MNEQRHHRLIPIAGALLAAAMPIAAAGCAGWSATPTPMPLTGVQGLVLAGPTCPVEEPEQSPCVRAVAGAEIVAFDENLREAGRAISNAQGYYFLPLNPGWYTIRPQQVDGLMGTAPPVTLQVTDGPPFQLNLDYDTGIR